MEFNFSLFYILIKICFFRYETIFSRNGFSLGYPKQDTSSVIKVHQFHFILYLQVSSFVPWIECITEHAKHAHSSRNVERKCYKTIKKPFPPMCNHTSLFKEKPDSCWNGDIFLFRNNKYIVYISRLDIFVQLIERVWAGLETFGWQTGFGSGIFLE